eukprot:15437221-Alexandrium_andersonii.AAC.1
MRASTAPCVHSHSGDGCSGSGERPRPKPSAARSSECSCTAGCPESAQCVGDSRRRRRLLSPFE